MSPNRLRKNLILFCRVLLIFTVSICLLNFLGSVYYKETCRLKIIQLIKDSSHNLYGLQVKDLHLNLLLGKIQLDELALEPDTVIYLRLKQAGKSPFNRYHLHAKSLVISFRQVYRLLFDGRLHIGDISLNEPLIHVENDSIPGQAGKRAFSNADFPLDKGLVSSIFIDNLTVNHGQISYLKTGHIKSEQFTCNSNQVYFHAESIIIDRNSFKSTLVSFLDKQKFTLDLNSLIFKKRSGSYVYTARKARIAKDDNEVRIEGLKMLPQFKVPEYILSVNENPGKDFMTLGIDNISLKVSAFFKMVKSGFIDIPVISIEGADFRYNSDGIPSTVLKKYDMPQNFLKKLSTRIKIDSIEIHHSTILYQDYCMSTHKNGRVIFNDINGVISHLSNDSSYLRKHKYLDIAIRTKLYNTGNLQLNITFDMQSKTDSFRYSGIMGYFPLTIINQVTVPLSSLQIIRGNAVNCWFDVCADKQGATGRLTGNYHNLYIKLLADDTTLAASHKMKTLSSLANMFMVLNDNPLINEPLRTEEIYNKRDENRSFFRFMWRSLLSGLKPTIGMQKGREENFTAFITKYQHFTNWHRSGQRARIIRRENRRHLRKLVRESHRLKSI